MDRPFAELGLALPDSTASIVTRAIALIGSAFLLYQPRKARRDPRALRRLRDQMRASESIFAIIPRTPREQRFFMVVSLAAGIGEEFAHRGFTLVYSAQFVPR